MQRADFTPPSGNRAWFGKMQNSPYQRTSGVHKKDGASTATRTGKKRGANVDCHADGNQQKKKKIFGKKGEKTTAEIVKKKGKITSGWWMGIQEGGGKRGDRFPPESVPNWHDLGDNWKGACADGDKEKRRG